MPPSGPQLEMVSLNRFAPLFQAEDSVHPLPFEQTAIQQDALDLDDGMGSQPAYPQPCSEVTGWITETDGTLFAQGSEDTNHFAKSDAYHALDMQDTVRTFFGLDMNLGEVATADVRSQPIDEDNGYATSDSIGHVPDMTAVVRRLLHSRDLILASQMVYLIVDNRTPTEVTHWPAFASWWSSRRNLVGPQEELTEVLWICADRESGLREVPYYWAGVFVLEAARFLFPKQHFGLIDNDCVPVTLFEFQDLVSCCESASMGRPCRTRSSQQRFRFQARHAPFHRGMPRVQCRSGLVLRQHAASQPYRTHQALCITHPGRVSLIHQARRFGGA